MNFIASIDGVNVKFDTIQTHTDGPVGYVRIFRPEANNTINAKLLTEMKKALALFDEAICIVVLEGLPEVFCFGADFNEISKNITEGCGTAQDPEILYNLWLDLARGPFISLAHVRGRVNAGGVGFVAACDIVIADENAVFSLSELLFGVFPACVMPFLVKRIGFRAANLLTLLTKPINVSEAKRVGLVDEFSRDSDRLLHQHLLRLRCLSHESIKMYKNYMRSLDDSLKEARNLAVKANIQAFSSPSTVEGICRYVETGRFPWEA